MNSTINPKIKSILWRLSPMLLAAAALLWGTSASAQVSSVDELSSAENDLMSQVTDIDQLSDVKPTDWAFQALQSLVERYGCIAGYPDGTYRGNRAMTRYEFAAGLNACLDKVLEQVVGPEGLDPEELAVIRRLQDEFKSELAILRGRVDALEARTAELEANQFSTTTKLKGEVIFGLTNVFGEDRALNSQVWAGRDDDDGEDNQADILDVADNATFGNRVRLVLDTSFTGKDALITRLQAGNLGNLNNATGTDEARLAYDSGADNDVILNRLQYRFPVGDKATAWIGTVGLDIDQIFDVTNPYLASDAVGVLSRFGRRNPAVHRGNEGAGLGLDFNFTDSVGLTFLYLANEQDAPSPLPKDGLFNGGYSAGAQLDFKPGNFQASLTYLHSYSPGDAVNLFGSTGTDFAQDPFGGVATSADHLGAQVNFKLGSRASIGGWYGIVFSGAESLNQGTDDLSATAQNWAANLAFPDLGGKGNLLGLVVGQPPHTTDNDVTTREEEDSPWHFELLYRIAVNDKISITPGAYYIMNPEGDERNDNILVGAIRTTFRF
jgi:hypothetical protein